jgi:hypothetical protein
MKDKGGGKEGGERMKFKAQRQNPLYILMNDDMDIIGYQIWDTTEEILEESTRKQEEQKNKVQD